MIKYPKKVNYKRFERNINEPEALYGLPTDVSYCKKCVISNQRPNSAVEFNHNSSTKKETIAFNDGICDACLYAEQKKSIDWNDREKLLIDLCNKHRKNDGSYDCIVPGSGGKDSFYAAHILKHKYGMHPLTVTWAPHIYTDWGWSNFQSWIHAGFDNYLMTPNGKVHRLLTRLAVENILHPFQPFMFGQKNLAPKMASLFNIPLVFFGENEAEYGNSIQDHNTSRRSEKYYSNKDQDDIYLGGTLVSDLINNYGLEKNDIEPYLPISENVLSEKKIEVHYLGYYLKWHPQSCYYYATENSSFKAAPERTSGTYSKYNSIDDKIDDLHYYTTGVKFGIGRATYDAAQEIRSGDINRDEGVALINKFDHEYPSRFENELFQYLSINSKDFPEASKNFEQPILDKIYFDNLVDSFRSPHLWIYENSSWKLRNPIK